MLSILIIITNIITKQKWGSSSCHQPQANSEDKVGEGRTMVFIKRLPSLGGWENPRSRLISSRKPRQSPSVLIQTQTQNAAQTSFSIVIHPLEWEGLCRPPSSFRLLPGICMWGPLHLGTQLPGPSQPHQHSGSDNPGGGSQRRARLCLLSFRSPGPNVCALGELSSLAYSVLFPG